MNRRTTNLRALIFLSLLIAQPLFSAITYPDFTVSMMRGGRGPEAYELNFLHCKNDENTRHLEIFRNIYARNVVLARRVSLLDKPRIPPIIHQIWIGSPVPYKLYAWMSSWMDWRGWKYMLWTDEEIKRIFLYNQELYDVSQNYGEKSDILRLELLLHYGGIYVDVDFEALNPSIFEELNRSFDFYVGFEPLEHGEIKGIYKICNAIIGACPHHPLIERLVVNLKKNWVKHQHGSAIEKTGPDYLSHTILEYEIENLSLAKTGYPEYLNMYFPCSFFYPLSEPETRSLKGKPDLLSKIFSETAAVHYWNQSWVPR